MRLIFEFIQVRDQLVLQSFEIPSSTILLFPIPREKETVTLENGKTYTVCQVFHAYKDDVTKITFACIEHAHK